MQQTESAQVRGKPKRDPIDPDGAAIKRSLSERRTEWRAASYSGAPCSRGCASGTAATSSAYDCAERNGDLRQHIGWAQLQNEPYGR
jgi:hypothetical protein